jgi:hypothetical protein
MPLKVDVMEHQSQLCELRTKNEERNKELRTGVPVETIVAQHSQVLVVTNLWQATLPTSAKSERLTRAGRFRNIVLASTGDPEVHANRDSARRHVGCTSGQHGTP